LAALLALAPRQSWASFAKSQGASVAACAGAVAAAFHFISIDFLKKGAERCPSMGTICEVWNENNELENSFNSVFVPRQCLKFYSNTTAHSTCVKCMRGALLRARAFAKSGAAAVAVMAMTMMM
jgi:hypothetical protein